MYRLFLVAIFTFAVHFQVFSTDTVWEKYASVFRSHSDMPSALPKLRIGVVYMNAPYIQVNDSSHEGFAMDVVEKVMSISGYQYIYKVDCYDNLMEGLMSDSLDIVFGCPQADPLWSQLLYSIPYEDIGYKVGKLHGASTNTEKYSEHSIAICREDKISSDIISTYFPNSKLVYHESLDEATRALYDGACDLLVCKESVDVANNIGNHRIDFSHGVLNTHTHLSACVKIEDYKLMQTINCAFVLMQDNLFIQDLRRNWFGDEDKLSAEYVVVQRNLTIAIGFCVVLITALLIIFVWAIYITYTSGKKKKYMLGLFNKIPVPLYILRKRRKKIVYEYINDVAKEEQFASRHDCTEEQAALHHKRLMTAYNMAHDTGETVSFVDRRKPVSPFSVYVNSVDFDSEKCGVKTVVNNEELLVLKEEAERNDQLVDDFLANISHEVRTPLNSILGFSQLLPELPVEDRQEALEIVEEKSLQLNKLINDILLLAKLETKDLEVNPAPCVLCSWMYDLLEEYKESISGDKPIDIIFDNSSCKCAINIDKQLLGVLLTSLIENAIKFTDKGEIHVGYLCVSTNVVIYVKDTGIGMSQEECDSIFERFTKVNTFTQGTGLGMPIALAISRLLNGYLGVYSKKDEGSTFYFCYSNVLPKPVQCKMYSFSKLEKIENAKWVDDFSINQLK